MYTFELLCWVSQCITVLDLACKPWPTLCWLKIHATCAGWNWESICAKSVTDWRHPNENTYDFIIRAWRSFAMIACKNPLMNVTSVGGKRSFIITLYLLIQWFKAVFHSTYGLQSINTHVYAVTATPLGFHVDGYAGDKPWLWITWYFSFNEQDDIVRQRSLSLQLSIRRGQLVFTERCRWILTRISKLRTDMSTEFHIL